jgi:hypothetical protein
MPKTRMTAAKVAKLAEQYLEKHQPSDYRIVIDPEGIKVDEMGWWEVPIHVTKGNVPSYDWIGRSVEASADLDEAEGLHVLFM